MMAQIDHPVMPRAITDSVTWEQQGDELVITTWYAQRQYNDWYFDLPMVVRIENPA